VPTYGPPVSGARLASATFHFFNLVTLERAANVMWFYATVAAPTTANFQGLADNLNAWDGGIAPYGDGYYTVRSDTWRLEQIVTRTKDGVLAGQNNPDRIGALTGVPAPTMLSACCTLRTAEGGRRKRGRVYVPSPSTTELDATAQVPVTYASEIDQQLTELGTLLTTSTTVGWEQVVYSRVSDSAQTVTSWTVDLLWDTQRRRGGH
jgi:hypothetical protein